MGEVIKVDQQNPSTEVVERAAQVLLSDGVIVMPTDSVYGLGCAARAGNPGHGRIFRIKHRDLAQTLPWLVASASDLDRYGRDVPAWARELVRRWWPGALTLVVRSSGEVPAEYRRADTGTIALRLPGSRLMVELVRRTGYPLANTSANTHGRPSATSGHGVEPRIVGEVDLTLDAGPAPIAVASTIVDCTTPRPQVLREGAIEAAEIARALS